MQTIMIGQYFPGSTVLHRLDPRAKLLFVFGFMILIFLANTALSYGLLLLFLMIAILVSKIPVMNFLRAVKPVLFLILLTFILHVFFSHGESGSVLWSTPLFTIYKEGIIQAIFISLRFILLVLTASLLTFTTSPVDITDGLEKLLHPLHVIRVPTHEIALMMSIALRFVPTLWAETEKIRKAQLARGAKFEDGPLWQRLKSYLPVLIPLFISAFRRAEDLAIAMESRCYRGGVGRTNYRQLRFHLLDGLLLAIFLLLVFAMWVLRK